MARIRTVKPSLFRHEELFDLEKSSGLPVRLWFIALFTCADKAGRFAWKPRQLKLDCDPYSQVDPGEVLDALAGAGFLLHYTVDGHEYGAFPNWSEHQRISGKEAADTSAIPQPPIQSASCAGKQPGSNGEATGKHPGALGTGTGTGKDIQEGEGRAQAPAPSALPFASPEFASAWQDWETHLRQKRVARTPTTREKQAELCAGWGESRAIAALKHSTASGYTGLFEPKGGGAVPFRSPSADLAERDLSPAAFGKGVAQ